MVTQFDEKGKIFTDIIQKHAVWVTIQLVSNRIHGLIHIRQEGRLKEELDDRSPFLAVTQAEIFSVDGKELILSSRFIALNKNQIIWLMPDSDEAQVYK
jgi:hypothetical protein